MAKAPTVKQRKLWGQIASLGCIVASYGCMGRTTIHHCFTGAGGRKNHDKVIPLCWAHHLGPVGIDGKLVSKRKWQERFGTEAELIEKTQKLLQENNYV